jgi:two-component system response regulator AtoC
VVSKETIELMMKYEWPGNVRELENVMERALVLDETGVIGPEDLPDKIRFGMQQRGTLVIDSPNMTIEELEREYILKVLHHTRWQKKRASEILGINASTLYRKLISYGFEKGVAEGEGGEAAA